MQKRGVCLYVHFFPIRVNSFKKGGVKRGVPLNSTHSPSIPYGSECSLLFVQLSIKVVVTSPDKSKFWG